MSMKIIWLSIFISFFLIGCNDSINGNDDTNNLNLPEKNVQIYNKNDGTLFTGNGVVNATIIPQNSERWVVQAGTITNGILNFSFPTTISNEKLEPFLGTYDHPNASNIPENTRFCGTLSTLRYPFIVYNSIGGKLGELKYKKTIMNGNEYVEDAVYYWYFNQDVKISGFFIFPEFTSSENLQMNHTENYQINAKKGWNRIYVHQTEVNKNIVIIYRTDLTNIPNDLKWEFE